jgi:Fe-S-cluster-containing hydrogenase component 2
MRYTNNRILIIEKDCIGCGRCIDLCPLGALSEGGDE